MVLLEPRYEAISRAIEFRSRCALLFRLSASSNVFPIIELSLRNRFRPLFHISQVKGNDDSLCHTRVILYPSKLFQIESLFSIRAPAGFSRTYLAAESSNVRLMAVSCCPESCENALEAIITTLRTVVKKIFMSNFLFIGF